MRREISQAAQREASDIKEFPVHVSYSANYICEIVRETENYNL